VHRQHRIRRAELSGLETPDVGTVSNPPKGAAAAGGRIAVVAILVVVAACAAARSLPDPLAAGWNGAPVCEKLHEDRAQRVLRCTFPPAVGHERHFHARHFGYAIAGGRMRITDSRGAREVDLATGSSFASDGVAWHEVVNVGETTVVYLLVEPK